jgi:hypothetical protein
MSPEQLQRCFEVALQFLKNEMLTAAAQKAKNKHPCRDLKTTFRTFRRHFNQIRVKSIVAFTVAG